MAFSTSSDTRNAVQAATQQPGADDYLDRIRQVLRQTITPPTPAEENAVRKAVAGRSVDREDYESLIEMLGIDPHWFGPRPWRTA